MDRPNYRRRGRWADTDHEPLVVVKRCWACGSTDDFGLSDSINPATGLLIEICQDCGEPQGDL